MHQYLHNQSSYWHETSTAMKPQWTSKCSDTCPKVNHLECFKISHTNLRNPPNAHLCAHSISSPLRSPFPTPWIHSSLETRGVPLTGGQPELPPKRNPAPRYEESWGRRTPHTRTVYLLVTLARTHVIPGNNHINSPLQVCSQRVEAHIIYPTPLERKSVRATVRVPTLQLTITTHTPP